VERCVGACRPTLCSHSEEKINMCRGEVESRRKAGQALFRASYISRAAGTRRAPSIRANSPDERSGDVRVQDPREDHQPAAAITPDQNPCPQNG
jgi:hypothetical protein